MQHLFSILEGYAQRDPACWEEWYHLNLWRVRDGAEGEPFVARGFDPDVVLQLVLMLDGNKAEVLKMSQGNVLTNIQNGSALLLTEQVIALLRALNGRRTVAQALDHIAPRYGEAVGMETLLALCKNGFLIPLGMENDLKPLPAGLAMTFTQS